MQDRRVIRVAGDQFNRVSRRQLAELGLSDFAIAHRVKAGRLTIVEEGVFAVSPVLANDDWGLWMGATLTAPASYLSNVSASAAHGWWKLPREFETITRPGSGGPRRHGGLIVYRSTVLAGDVTELHGIPITTVPRTLLDLAREVGGRALARSVREAVRLELTTLPEIGDCLGKHRGRRGCGRLAKVVARYSGLPLERARSGAEVRAMEVLRDNRCPLPRLNVRIAGEEADLSWPEHRLIVEIDGGPFHLDVGEDARKEAVWKAAGWDVQRLDAEALYETPQALLTLAPPSRDS